MLDKLQIVDEIYDLVQQLPRFDSQTPPEKLPENGVYFFFELGETVKWQDKVVDRLVRVGTHREDRRFRKRIRQHYGNVKSLHGNKNGSVFRKHLGGAILRKENPSNPKLKDWETQGSHSFPEVEEKTSQVLRSNFTFCCFRVDNPKERKALESGLIALLAQHPLSESSEEWLGKYAKSEKIRCTGLWNTQHVKGEPLTSEEFQRVKQLVKETLIRMV